VLFLCVDLSMLLCVCVVLRWFYQLPFYLKARFMFFFLLFLLCLYLFVYAKYVGFDCVVLIPVLYGMLCLMCCFCVLICSCFDVFVWF